MITAAAKPIVVGIDGSEQAERAAQWAVEEAVAIHAPLRLVYVVRTDLSGQLSAEEYRTAVNDAKSALQSVRKKIASSGPPVVVNTEIAEGSPAGVLLAESPYATMICLGSSGIGRLGAAVLGSTAATVAERASCSVAIIRSSGEVGPASAQTKWVIVPVSMFADNDVIDAAIDQARLLRRPVLAVGVRHPECGGTPSGTLDSMVADWHARYPDVHIYPVASDNTMTKFLHEHPGMVSLVVIDAPAAGDVASIIGAEHHSQSDEVEHAVLVARDYANREISPTPAMS